MQLALQLIVAVLKPLQGFPLAVHIGPLLEREHTPSMAKKREGEGEKTHCSNPRHAQASVVKGHDRPGFDQKTERWDFMHLLQQRYSPN